MSVTYVGISDSAVPASTLIEWKEAGVAHSALWRSERGALPPRRIVEADDGRGERVEVVRDQITHVPQQATFRSDGEVRSSLSVTDTGSDVLVDKVEGPGGVARAFTCSAE